MYNAQLIVGNNAQPLVYAVDDRNISKVVDENGEPKVKWRGDNNPKNVFDYINYGGHGVYYFGDVGFAESFGDKLNSYFINCRNPFIPNKLTKKEEKEIRKILQKDSDKILIEQVKQNGLDNLYFLLMVLNKPSNTKYFAITYSWDNISSKLILSKKLDHIALWNGVQQEEIKEIYGSELIASSVIGSKLADRSHKFYSKMKTNTQNSPDSKTLLFLGLFNKSDEFLEVLKIHELIQTSNIFWYKKIVYRPHPLSRSNLKQINYDLASQLEIEVNQDKHLNLNNYGGIICLPTSIIFEVIVSGKPAILYAPKHPKYRTDPYNVLKYKHFEVIRDLKPLPIITEFNTLQDALTEPFPIQNKLDTEQMHRIFPKFSTSYDSRISFIIENL
jgi:hypothetical protein